jgi:hypothetical protein
MVEDGGGAGVEGLETPGELAPVEVGGGVGVGLDVAGDLAPMCE